MEKGDHFSDLEMNLFNAACSKGFFPIRVVNYFVKDYSVEEAAKELRYSVDTMREYYLILNQVLREKDLKLPEGNTRRPKPGK